jgi:uncharacterized coiled-coil protein SlyX
MADSLADAVTDLEIRVAYQDRALTALDEVVQLLHKRVDQLEHELAEARLAATESQLPLGPANEPPPHY